MALLAVASFAAAAQAPIPPLTARVTDQTSTLTPEQKAGLEETLRAFEARKGSQIAVLRSEEHTSELQSQSNLVCRLLLEKKNKSTNRRRLTKPAPSAPRCHRMKRTSC